MLLIILNDDTRIIQLNADAKLNSYIKKKKKQFRAWDSGLGA